LLIVDLASEIFADCLESAHDRKIFTVEMSGLDSAAINKNRRNI